MRLIVGISGASGVKLGIRFLESLPKDIEKYCVISKNAQNVLEKEVFKKDSSLSLESQDLAGQESLANSLTRDSLEEVKANLAQGCFTNDCAQEVRTSSQECFLNFNSAQKLQNNFLDSKLCNIPNLRLLDNENLGECIASGSFVCDSMAVIPCSLDTLAKIACGICDTLLLRAASVMLKERRKLLLAPREIPFSAIALENMLKLSRLGVIIAPPVLGYYAGESLEDIENLLIGKWCDNLGIPYDYPRWNPSGI